MQNKRKILRAKTGAQDDSDQGNTIWKSTSFQIEPKSLKIIGFCLK